MGPCRASASRAARGWARAVEREDPHLETAERVGAAGLGIKADFHRIAAPMPFDVVGRDIADKGVVPNAHIDEEAGVGVGDAKHGAAVGGVFGFALDAILMRNRDGRDVVQIDGRRIHAGNADRGQRVEGHGRGRRLGGSFEDRGQRGVRRARPAEA